jgi:hypothetical protein
MPLSRTASATVAFVFALFIAGCAAQTPAPDAPPPPEPQPVPEQAPADAPAALNLRVDHVWVKDAESPDEQGMQQQALKKLREKIVAGGGFVTSWNELGVDGTNWHVAEQESYPGDVLPEPVRALPDGAISPIIPGDGGLHLFRVIAREPAQ